MKLKNFKVTGIKWVTDGETIDLPTDRIVECHDEYSVVDILSDIYGFLIESVEQIEEIKLHYYKVNVKYKDGSVWQYGIPAENETEMWKEYDKICENKDDIISSEIVYS